MAKAEEDRVRRIEELVRRVDGIADEAARENARQLMEAILELYGAGLERVMELAFDSGAAGQALIRKFASDNLVASLLVLHNLHPDDLETRVRQVLAKLPGRIELMSVFDNRLRVRILAGNTGAAVEAALRDAVPDLVEITVEETSPADGFVPLAMLGALPSTAN